MRAKHLEGHTIKDGICVKCGKLLMDKPRTHAMRESMVLSFVGRPTFVTPCKKMPERAVMLYIRHTGDHTQWYVETLIGTIYQFDVIEPLFFDANAVKDSLGSYGIYA